MKKILGIALIVLLLVGGIFLCFGTMEIRYENVISVVEHEWVNDISEELYTGVIEIDTEDLPTWCEPYYQGEAQLLSFDLGERQMRLALFADFVCVEKIQQSKNILTGKLLEETRRRYYRPQGNVTIEPIERDLEMITQFDHDLIITE